MKFPEERGETARASRALRTLRWCSNSAVAGVMLAAIVVASARALADFDRDSRARSVGIAGVSIGSGDEMISIRVRSLTCDATEQDEDDADYEMWIGVAQGDEVSEWTRADVIEPNADPRDRYTVVATDRAGELLFAVGPLTDMDEARCKSAPNAQAARVVEIGGAPYAIVHREPVRTIIARHAREKKTFQFGDAALGVEGRIDLRSLT